MAIDAFLDHSTGVALTKSTKTNTPGPKPIYNDEEFLRNLQELLDQGKSYSQITDLLGVSGFTINRAKNYLKEKGLIQS